MEFIDLKTQQKRILGLLFEGIRKVLSHSQYIMWPEMKKLEDKLSKYVGAKHSIANSSVTDALLSPLMAMCIGAGEMITLSGAKPVFVDLNHPDLLLRAPPKNRYRH